MKRESLDAEEGGKEEAGERWRDCARMLWLDWRGSGRPFCQADRADLTLSAIGSCAGVGLRLWFDAHRGPFDVPTWQMPGGVVLFRFEEAQRSGRGAGVGSLDLEGVCRMTWFRGAWSATLPPPSNNSRQWRQCCQLQLALERRRRVSEGGSASKGAECDGIGDRSK